MRKISRRSFMQSAGVLGAMAALTACGGNSTSTSTAASGSTASSASQTELSENGEQGDLSETVQAAEVVESIPYDITTLAPWESATSGRLNVMQTIYEYMAYYDSTEACGMRGILMESYEKLDTYTSRVKIYDYIKDSAGNPLTADDVVYSFTTWKNNAKSVKCKLLDSVTAVDQYTVDIKLNADTVGDVENMLCGLVPIITQAAHEASDDGMYAHVVSTSPYIVQEFVEGDHLTVVKNENYWQTNDALRQRVSQANVDKVTFKIVTESAQVSVNLETNTTDMASMVSGSEVSRFESNDNYNVYAVPGGNFSWITFNVDPEQGMFYNNVKLRQAIAYAIDAEGLVAGAVGGRGTTCHAFGNPECVDYNPEWDEEPYYEYDLEKAKQLLAESGFDTSRTIRIMYSSGSTQKSAAAIYQSYLIALGLKVELLGYEAALFQTYKTEPGEWDIEMDEVQSVDFVSSAASKFDNRVPAVNFAQDETLQELVELIITSEGHTSDNLDAYMNYLKDQCYVYCVYRENYNYVTENTISGIFTNFKGYLIPGACSYTAAFTR
jgi:ABC-type transport system substrate-binding protein